MSKTKSLVVNTSSLLIIQVANYILPFILIPYLTQTLGVELYGVVAFGLALGQVSLIITDFGFNLSSTYQIAQNRNDKNYINSILSAVFTSKVILLLGVIVVLVIYSSLQVKYFDQRWFLLLMSIPVIGQTFQPVWFFQGIEKMVFITIFTLLSKVLYVSLVLILVKNGENLIWVAVANGVGQITASLAGVIVIYRLGYSFVWPGWTFVKNNFRQSTSYFWSRAAVATYSVGGAFYLGLFSSPSQTAFYSAAEQLYRAGRSLLDSLAQALYPSMTNTKNFNLFFKILIGAILFSFAGLVFGLLFGKSIIMLVFGEGYEASYSILIVLLIAFIISTPSVLLGYPFLGAMKRTDFANRSVIYAGLFQTTLLMFCYFFDFISANEIVFTVVLSELFVLLLRGKFAWKLWHVKSRLE